MPTLSESVFPLESGKAWETAHPKPVRQPAHSSQRKESYLPQWAAHNHGVASGNFLTCYGLRFVEQRPGDQSGTGGGLILGVNARAPYLAACDAVAAAPLISWVMSPSSGQAIIWCTIQESNLKPIA